MNAESPLAISIVVPCYRSGSWLAEFAAEVTDVMETAGRSFELILVNDGSPDGVTWPAIEAIARADRRVIGVDLLRNVGQFAALMAGLGEASGEVVVTLDDDFQHPPAQIPILLAALDQQPLVDCVIGAYAEKRHPLLRNIGSSIMDVFYRRSYGKPAGLKMGSFRAMRRPVVEGMLSFGTARPVPGALLLQTTQRIANVPVEHHPRREGSSGYGAIRLITSTLETMLNASTAPLRSISLLGIGISFFSVLAMIYYLALGFAGRVTVAGFTTLVLLVTFFGGATLFAVGLLGEYVARLVVEVGRPPLYLVRATTRDRNHAE